MEVAGRSQAHADHQLGTAAAFDGFDRGCKCLLARVVEKSSHVVP